MKIDAQSIPNQCTNLIKKVGRYRVVLFLLFVAGLYTYLVIQINTAARTAPSSVQTAQVRATPRIDPVLVDQLKQLQDNSVSVQALFNEARTNPFQ